MVLTFEISRNAYFDPWEFEPKGKNSYIIYKLWPEENGSGASSGPFKSGVSETPAKVDFMCCF